MRQGRRESAGRRRRLIRYLAGVPTMGCLLEDESSAAEQQNTSSLYLFLTHPTGWTITTPLKHPVIWIGSDPSCEVQLSLPGLAPTAYVLLQTGPGYYGVPVDGYIPPTGPLGHWWPAEQDVPLGPLSLGVQTYGTPRATWPAGPFPWLLEWSDDQTRFAWRLPTSVTLIGRDARCTLHHREKSLQPIHAALICLPHVVRLVPLCCPPTLTDTRERYVDLRADAMFEVGDWVFHLRRVPQPYAGLADKFPRVSADPGASQASEFSSMSPSADDEVSENLQFPPLGTAKSG